MFEHHQHEFEFDMSNPLPVHVQYEHIDMNMTQGNNFTRTLEQDDSDSDPHSDSVEWHSEVVILAPFLLLAIGALLRHSTKSLPLPYTMQLLVLGTLLGLLLRGQLWSGSGSLKQSIEILGNLDPHLMLHIFLPPLIFESAASLEWHLFTRAKWHIMSLAGPGLLMASGLTGLVLDKIVGQSAIFTNDSSTIGSECGGGPNDDDDDDVWTFQMSLMLGVIMSATDPVAVVALLKELGCKASLSTTIEGESLLNDGTALVMFTILLKLAEGDEPEGLAEYLLQFIKMSCGGALFGIIFGVFVVQWLRLIFNDALAEITITLSAAYLCFFIAEYFFHISGVLAVVTLGLYFGHTGRTAISPEVAHFIEDFWQCLGFIGNTLIFVIGGTVIGYKLPSFPASEFFQMIIMYVVCAIIRVIVIGVIYVVFKSFGARVEYKDQIVAAWAGLRGAVGLSLAMMVFGNTKICGPVRDMVMFHTAGIVVLTVCINSITMPFLVRYLGFDSVAPSKQLVYNQAMKNLMDAGKKQEANIRSENIFDSCIWDEARKYYFHVDTFPDDHGQENHNSTMLAEKEARRRVLMITKKSYWTQFGEGLLSHQSVKYLIHHTDIAIDNACSLNEWQTYMNLIRIGSTIEKGTDKLVASKESSEAEKQRVKILNTLDSVPSILVILLLVFASCILPFTLDPRSTAFRAVERSVTVIFTAELCLRLYCLQDWHPCVVDPYIAFDIMTVMLDIVLLSAEGTLGDLSAFSKSIRTIRFLRLFRLLRVAGIFRRLNKVRFEAMNEPTTLLEKETVFKRYQRRLIFNQLKFGFEVATGFKVAREEVLAAMVKLQNEENHLDFENIRRDVKTDLKNVRTSLLDVQRLYVEIAASITTSLAARTVLNKQRHSIDDLYQEGCLDFNEYNNLKGSVEFQMKTLTYQPPNLSMPSKVHILRQIPWLECLDEEELSKVSSSFEDAVFQRGDVLVRQNERTESVHVLARGTVTVSILSESGGEVEIDDLGMGSVFGEIAWALNIIRGATITATSPGLLFTISGEKLRDIADTYSELNERLWDTCGKRVSENLIAQRVRESTRREVRELVHEMELNTIDPFNKRISFYKNGHIVLLRGVAILPKDDNGKSKTIEAPKLLPTIMTDSDDLTFDVEFSTDAKIVCAPNVINDGVSQPKRMTLLMSGDHAVDLETNKSNTAFLSQLDKNNDGTRSRTQGATEISDGQTNQLDATRLPKNQMLQSRHSSIIPAENAPRDDAV